MQTTTRTRSLYTSTVEELSEYLCRHLNHRVEQSLSKNAGARQAVRDPSSYPWHPFLVANYELIRAELDDILVDVDQFSTIKTILDDRPLSPTQQWRQFTFYFWGEEIPYAMQRCPETARILRNIPNIHSATFSVLYPGTRIAPHSGEFKGLFRSHLGLKIPGDGTQCGLEVDDQLLRAKEGEVITFDHSCTHEAWNDSDELRVVLLFDVERNDLSFPWTLVNKAALWLENRTRYVRDSAFRLRRSHENEEYR